MKRLLLLLLAGTFIFFAGFLSGGIGNDDVNVSIGGDVTVSLNCEGVKK